MIIIVHSKHYVSGSNKIKQRFFRINTIQLEQDTVNYIWNELVNDFTNI